MLKAATVKLKMKQRHLNTGDARNVDHLPRTDTGVESREQTQQVRQLERDTGEAFEGIIPKDKVHFSTWFHSA
ncbi:hypothetical protein STEG23_024472 [Scotinomys teguina]